jgi:hypothetical protein
VNKHCVLAKGAAADLKEIVRHTNEQWGEAQCLTYIHQLENAAIAVAKGEGVFKDYGHHGTAQKPLDLISNRDVERLSWPQRRQSLAPQPTTSPPTIPANNVSIYSPT